MKRQYHKISHAVGWLLLPLFLSHCSSHRLEIPQGNQISTHKIAQLKTGMSKQQVEFLLGTPLIQDPFHYERWDYVYQTSQGEKQRKKMHIVITFEEGRIKTYQIKE